MKRLYNQALYVLLSFLLLVTSCTNEDTPLVDDGNRTLVTFSSSVADDVATRATDTLWDLEDSIGVFMKTAGTSFSSENILNGAANKQYTTSTTNGNFRPLSGQGIYYPEDGSKVDFIAYYPYRKDLEGYIYKVDLTEQPTAAAVDLMYADNLKEVGKTATTSQLIFSRPLSGIALNITAGHGISSMAGLSVTLKGTHARADFNLATGELTVDEASVADIRIPLQTTSAGVSGRAVVLPTRNLNGASLVFTTLGGKSYTLRIADGTALSKGQRLVYNVELQDSGVTEEHPAGGQPTWFETPVLTSGENLMYISHYMPEDKKVRNYSMLYDKQNKLAYWVAYPLHKYYIGTTKRTDAWAYDPDINTNWQARLSKGFGGNNIDRGHQLPSADRTSSTAANRTTFYFSNMTAQVGQGLNQSIWANLEGQVRSWMAECDTLYVVTGAMITTATDKTVTYVTDNDGAKVAKPKYYFKALAKKKGTNYYTIGFRFNNEQYSGTNYDAYRVTVTALEQETGFTFFPKLSSDVKGKIDVSQWN